MSCKSVFKTVRFTCHWSLKVVYWQFSIMFKAKSSRFPCLVDKSGQTSSLQRSSTCQWRRVDGRASQTDGDFFSFRWQGLPIKDNQILLPQASMLHDHCPALGMLPDATSTVHRTKVTVLMDHDKLIERERESLHCDQSLQTHTNTMEFPKLPAEILPHLQP